MVRYIIQALFLTLCVWLTRGTTDCTRTDRTKGRCQDLEECLDKGGSADSAGTLQLCHTRDFNRVVICCRTSSADIARRKCREWQEQRKKVGSSCAVTIPLVHNGQEADVGEFPHIVSIQQLNNKRVPVHICGGSLIAPDWVLTAAHCITGKQIEVRLGAHDFREKEQGITSIVHVRKTVIHPNFDPPQRYNDIALLELQHKAHIHQRIQPACLPFKKNRVKTSDQLVVAGWGDTDKGTTTQVLMKAKVNSISRYACDEYYKLNNAQSHLSAFPGGITDSIICVSEDDQGSCRGDSGGPLMLGTSEDCAQEIVGLVSRGVQGCSSTSVPGLYTNIEYYLDWIVNNVWRDEF